MCTLEAKGVSNWHKKTNRANPNAPLVVPLSTPIIEIMVPRRLTWESPYWTNTFKDNKFQ